MGKESKDEKLTSNSYVNADMSLGEIIEKYPETIPVLLKHGLHCIGCHVASWETLRDGLMAHGMDEKGIKSVVEELNKVIGEHEKILNDAAENE